MGGFIDIVVNMHTPDVYQDRAAKGGNVDESFRRQTRSDAVIKGVTIEDYLKKMDEAGIERSLLIATRNGDLNVRGSYHLPYEKVAEVCHRFPDRFSGLAGIDPTLGVKQLRELEYAVKELKFVGAHYYPHWFELAPDEILVTPQPREGFAIASERPREISASIFGSAWCVTALTMASPISTEPAIGFSVKTGRRDLSNSGTRVPCRVNGCEPEHGPLSEVKINSVLSSKPSSCNAARSRPKTTARA